MDYSALDLKIKAVRGFSLSSPYFFGPNLGQPKGVKSVGFVEVELEDGSIGIGETYAGVYAPELVGGVAAFISNYVRGMSIGDDVLATRLEEIPFLGREGLVRSVSSALEIAVWDLRGKALGVPVFELLEGSDSVTAYSSGGSAAAQMDEVAREADVSLTKGFAAFKMRVGLQEWSKDIARVSVASERMGIGNVMIDAIMGTLRPAWSARLAISRAKDLEPVRPRWLEEPVFPGDFESLRQVKESANIPIAAGESYTARSDFDRVMSSGSVDIIQFDATHAGGILPCVSLAKQAQNSNLSSAVHVWGSAAAIASNAAVASVGQGEVLLEVPLAKLSLTDAMWIESPAVNGGKFLLPRTPGLGIRVDDEIKEQFRFVPGSGYKL